MEQYIKRCIRNESIHETIFQEILNITEPDLDEIIECTFPKFATSTNINALVLSARVARYVNFHVLCANLVLATQL
eukprot:2936473-Amphidinium_carterae.1